MKRPHPPIAPARPQPPPLLAVPLPARSTVRAKIRWSLQPGSILHYGSARPVAIVAPFIPPHFRDPGAPLRHTHLPPVYRPSTWRPQTPRLFRPCLSALCSPYDGSHPFPRTFLQYFPYPWGEDASSEFPIFQVRRGRSETLSLRPGRNWEPERLAPLPRAPTFRFCPFSEKFPPLRNS